MIYSGVPFTELGKKIKALRVELGITQRELAEGIVTRNMLSRIENGLSMPSLSTLSAIATRLNVSSAYLVDDHDDGTRLKNKRLLSMITKEFSCGNYELCLQYLTSLEYFPEEKERLTACSMYLLGVQKSIDCSPIRVSQKLISDALKNSDLLTHKMKSEGIVLRALLDEFQFSPDSGNEENYLVRLNNFASAPCDLSLFSSVLSVLKNNGPDCAQIMLDSIVFVNSGYKSILLASISMDKKNYSVALTKLLDALSFDIPSPLRCYCLTLLEKCSAMQREFEKAYSYMTMRKDLVTKLLKKVENY